VREASSGARECEGARKRGRERAGRENEHANLLNYIILHTIITLDIHYVYCIYVSIIVVSYIAMMMTIMSTIITDDFVEGRGKCNTSSSDAVDARYSWHLEDLVSSLRSCKQAYINLRTNLALDASTRFLVISRQFNSRGSQISISLGSLAGRA